VVTAGAVTAVAGSAYLYATNEGLWRYMRVGASLLPMGVDYAYVSWRARGLPEAAASAAFRAYHVRWADEPLAVCLDLRGFYVKIGQILSGQPDMIPEPYGRSLKVLQEAVPPQPWDLVRNIVEGELGRPLCEVFATFDEAPIGAASIGQVHRATLRDGRGVVVKVQYPDTERFFRMDFEVILRIFEVVNPELVDALAIQRDCFAQEFDYRREAANLRTVYDRVRPRFANLDFPQPYDAAHPALPRGAPPLVTKRVLVMDACAGETVTKFGEALLARASAARGMTVEAFKEDLLARMKDPAFVDDFVRAAPSEWQFELFRRSLLLRNAAANACTFAYNQTAGRWYGARRDYARALAPPRVRERSWRGRSLSLSVASRRARSSSDTTVARVTGAAERAAPRQVPLRRARLRALRARALQRGPAPGQRHVRRADGRREPDRLRPAHRRLRGGARPLRAPLHRDRESRQGHGLRGVRAARPALRLQAHGRDEPARGDVRRRQAPLRRLRGPRGGSQDVRLRLARGRGGPQDDRALRHRRLPGDLRHGPAPLLLPERPPPGAFSFRAAAPVTARA